MSGILLYPWEIGSIRLDLPESAPAAGDGIILDLENCDFATDTGNPIGYKRWRNSIPQVSYTIAGGSAIAYDLFNPKHDFQFVMDLEPNDLIVLQSIIEEQFKRIRDRSTTVVGVKLLDRRQITVERAPRERARDGGAVTLPGLTVPTGTEAFYGWYNVLFQYNQQYFDFLLRDGLTSVDGLIRVQLAAKELDIIPTSEDTAIF